MTDTIDTGAAGGAGAGARVAELLDRRRRLDEGRAGWLAHWQELAEVMLPGRADFTGVAGGGGAAGARRAAGLYDGTPMLARRALAAALDGLLKPKTARWFSLRAADRAADRDEATRRWLGEAERILTDALYARPARFIQASGEVDNDLVTFGTGVLFIGERRDLGGLVFRSIHLRDAVVDSDGDGTVDTIFVTLRRTARQAARAWGEANLGARTRAALRQERGPEHEFTFVQAVMPRADALGADAPAGRADAGGLPFASLLIDVESAHLVAESGFHEFPFAVPRWETAPGEVYGRSPGMVALPDARTLQAMGKTLLIGGQKAVDPPFWVADDAVIGAPRTYPGGITYIDSSVLREGRGIPSGPIETGKNIPLGREMQNDVREQVWQAFFRNVLNMPVAGPAMTATEVIERREEFVRTIGPVFGQLEADYVAAVVERAFAVLLRAGAFPPPPDALRGRGVRFEYVSPVARARRQMEALGLARAAELMAPFAAVEPGMMERFDADAIARDVPEIFGAPHDWLRDDAALAERRAARAAEAAGQGLAALLGDAAAVPGARAMPGGAIP
ncbi:MAG: portal protein [Alphaproteobacteria bacterium]